MQSKKYEEYWTYEKTFQLHQRGSHRLCTNLYQVFSFGSAAVFIVRIHCTVFGIYEYIYKAITKLFMRVYEAASCVKQVIDMA